MKWLFYSVFAAICWAGWALCSKFGSLEVPEREMQFLFGIGALPIALVLYARQSVRLARNRRGIAFGLLNGLFSAVGMIALFAADRVGGNTSAVTAVSAAFPAVTVILAMLFLKERISLLQGVGVALALAAVVLFSF